jgi:hypothetical protein
MAEVKQLSAPMDEQQQRANTRHQAAYERGHCARLTSYLLALDRQFRDVVTQQRHRDGPVTSRSVV